MVEGDLAYRLAEEQKRLAKLWDAYEAQEQELKQAMKKIAILEAKLKEKERINASLRELAEARDREIRETEVTLSSLKRENDENRPQIETLNDTLRNERERYNKLFAITQELEEELNLTQVKLEARDRWFEEHMGTLRRLAEALDEREAMIRVAGTGTVTRDQSPLPSKARFSVVGGKADVVRKPQRAVKTPTAQTAAKTPEKMSKQDIITLFMTLPDIDRRSAEALYNDGFSTLGELKQASIRELQMVPGLTTETAQKIHTYVVKLP